MSGRQGRALAGVLVALVGGLVLALAVKAALEFQYLAPDPLAVRIAGLTVPLAVAAGATLALLVAYHALVAGLKRRGADQAVRSLRTLQTMVAVLVVALVVAAIAGDVTSAFLSLGLVGFGVTLALQRPILSIAGWAVIHFGHLFKEGDRIEVTGIVGDVLDVSLFKTRLWEIGSKSSPLSWGGSVSPLRATGRVVTLSNATFVEEPVANANVAVPYVFDEFAVTIAYEADRALAEDILVKVGKDVVEPEVHARAAVEFDALTQGTPMAGSFPHQPVVIVALLDSWIELRLRYLVNVRERAAVRTRLARAWLDAIAPHAQRLPNVYPRIQTQAVNPEGQPAR